MFFARSRAFFKLSIADDPFHFLPFQQHLPRLRYLPLKREQSPTQSLDRSPSALGLFRTYRFPEPFVRQLRQMVARRQCHAAQRPPLWSCPVGQTGFARYAETAGLWNEGYGLVGLDCPVRLATLQLSLRYSALAFPFIHCPTAHHIIARSYVHIDSSHISPSPPFPYASSIMNSIPLASPPLLFPFF